MSEPPSHPPASPPPALPPRPPRPLVVHVLIDAAVAFLLTALVFWLIGLPVWVTILFAIGIGIGAGPSTRRAEERALAERERD